MDGGTGEEVLHWDPVLHLCLDDMTPLSQGHIHYIWPTRHCSFPLGVVFVLQPRWGPLTWSTVGALLSSLWQSLDCLPQCLSSDSHVFHYSLVVEVPAKPLQPSPTAKNLCSFPVVAAFAALSAHPTGLRCLLWSCSSTMMRCLWEVDHRIMSDVRFLRMVLWPRSFCIFQFAAMDSFSPFTVGFSRIRPV